MLPSRSQSIDPAHPVDRDLLDQQLFLDELLVVDLLGLGLRNNDVSHAGEDIRQRRATCVGNAANPRTFTLWTRTAPSASISYDATDRTSSSRHTRVSSRAIAAPRQKWRPNPKLAISDVSRPMRNSSPSGNTAVSRLAEPG